MNETYDAVLDDLRREIDGGGARPAMIDELVVRLLQLSPAVRPADFLSLLRDDADYYEGMFSLIHTAETVEDMTYIEAVLLVFCDIAAKAPQWASVVLIRILNSPPTQAELIRQLANAPLPARQAIRKVCKDIAQDSPEFLAKTLPVTLAARD
ncbi:hypothetical protein J2T09_003121 [Neorhizobium huautlense]|uniref:Immunity protein 30 domain-containing protein n=1 Tax=Neorhizobium huautlense TaxID=67774 RepID=A0ABT9PWT2_9HYPH|nr:Imm30 family immunity protein [Neorhizobium huautlense]MDP9838354.1 hypothetical protein [Neorhizobium huautlense]